jgi:predicted Zn-dependent peptidase
MTRICIALLAIFALCGARNASAETRLRDNLHLIELSNGMKVFVYPRHAAPLFSGIIYVDAGSAEEQVGQTGLAHLLEHMAFKGTPWIGTRDWAAEKPILDKIEEVGSQLTSERQRGAPDEERVEALSRELADLHKQAAQYIVPNEYDQIITREGGQEVNASTDVDYTNYYMSMPANKLEMWAMMESQRLLYPAWREFYLERDVVAEERRMRTEDDPLGRLYEDFTATAFKSHPYRNPVIGWMTDIFNLTVTRVEQFYREWYVPENFVAVIVGDVQLEEVRSVMEKYFGSVPARKSPPRAITAEPPQKGEKRISVLFDAQPRSFVGWHKPTFPDRDTYVFEVIQFLMTRTGRTSRLYERLVKRDAICQQVESWTGPGDKYPNLYTVMLVPRAPHTLAEAEKAMLEEVDRLKNEPVGEAELSKIRNQIDAAFLKELETNIGLGKRLGYYYIASRDPDIMDKLREEMKAVTPQDVQRVAQKYLTNENRTTAELVTRPRSLEPEAGGVQVPSKEREAAEAIRIEDVETTGGEQAR